MAKLTFTLFGKTHEAADMASASALFSSLRDKSGRGSSTMPLPEIMLEGAVVGHFSYNGKVWENPSRDWTPVATPIFNPHQAAA
ncbi:hypothetical protein LH464_04305 [Neorhizobium sp. T786]|uniref:hypothetical protein n=1 Tax=Pseudorhizobium xiangyangii TaxID=2883104 RepID=UPI001D0010D3|nr:hypothetical protein [Neorhizobium xiangyangii]MCB5201700.1 hypothetical protein [Neorhizobium xiangyangii]